MANKSKSVQSLTLNEVLARAVKTPAIETRGRKNKFAQFISEGHVVPDTNVVWYMEGDGETYGFKSDKRLAESLSHHGFKPVKIK